MGLKIIPYNREKAAAYAQKWALSRNERYYDFSEIGGDCTNFASQCIFAGSGIMNYDNPTGWYYNTVNDRAAAWTSVEYLYRFLMNNKGVGPFASVVSAKEILPGDIVQLKISRDVFHHSPVVVRIVGNPTPDIILVAAHSFDCNQRPLSSYATREARFLRIDGVRQYG